MRTRPIVLFWGATAGAVLFLGAAWTTLGRAFSPAGSSLDAAILGVAAIGLLVSVFISGRIVLVTARVQRRRAKR